MLADEDLHRHAVENLVQADALLFGRVTYEMMEAAWRPSARTGASPDWMEPFARTIDGARKYVVSSTLNRVDWNAELVHGDLATAVQKLKRESGRGLFVGGVKLPLAWLLGSLLGLSAAATTGSAILSSFWFLLLGGLVIADAKLSLGAMTALAALLGLVHGYLNGTGMGQSGFVVVALLGLTSGVFVLIVLAAAFVVQLRVHWARIAVRVAGSWIAASGLLMLGWSLRGS